ncbi:MAG: sulfite exporter TauE/SafE family protein [Clostridia bacterium]|nr:sulfite exporter TauE/SafE family protein [Clostridia bacterium]
MKYLKNNIFLIILGFLTGICNGLFGAGGGIIAVETLKKQGLKQKQAQATSIAVILPLCVVSIIFYFFKNNIDFSPSLYLIPAGILGACLGTYFMKKFPPKIIKNIFCIFIIYAGIRMIVGK